MADVRVLLIAALWPCLSLAADDAARRELYLGADLSYVNEMEDCGGVLRENGKPRDAFELCVSMAAISCACVCGTTPTGRSTAISTTCARRCGARVLPACARCSTFTIRTTGPTATSRSFREPGRTSPMSMCSRRRSTISRTARLTELARDGLMPDWVQVGNETNGEILGRKEWDKHRPIQWQRNARLFNAGIRAVRDCRQGGGFVAARSCSTSRNPRTSSRGLRRRRRPASRTSI